MRLEILYIQWGVFPELAVTQDPREILNRFIAKPDGARREARSRIRPPLEDEFGEDEIRLSGRFPGFPHRT